MSNMRRRVTAQRQRRRIRHLLAQDDRTLSDIGHSRNDLLQALHRPRCTTASKLSDRELMISAGLSFQTGPSLMYPVRQRV